jgi:co-chaperonin GroES (HSP10)
MRAPFSFIVSPRNGDRYDNVSKSGLILSASKEDHKTTNRYAVVNETPNNYRGPISKGDQVIVHHNVFKYHSDMKGREKSHWGFLGDNNFSVTDSLMFAYVKQGVLTPLDGYLFVRPDKDNTGEIVHINESLTNKGFSVGDIISYTPHSSYEFKIDDEVLYRVREPNITMVWK